MHVTIDQATKLRAQGVARHLGVPLNKLVCAYVKEIADRKIDVPVSRMSKKLEKILDQVEKDIKTGKNMVGPFHSGKEAADYLRSL